MNPLSIVLSSVAGTFITVAVAVLVVKAWSHMSAAMKVLPDLSAQIRSISSSIDKYLALEVQLKTSTDSLKSIPSLMEGLMKLCAAQVAAIAELRKTVKGLQEAIFKRDDIRSLETPGDGEKNLAWEAKRIQAENPGMDTMTAMMRAIEQETKDLNGASGAGEFQL